MKDLLSVALILGATLSLVFGVADASAQRTSHLPQNQGWNKLPGNVSNRYSQMPIRLPLSLSGGYAEIRPNHFHSGLDIRTGGKEGQPVYAPADGYVSRINISAWGGGKVLYITHADGYRTVYMHLSSFCGEIGDFVHKYQYSHRTFAFDTELPHDSIRVKKGDLVALTGNTGGSMGPHLHYEIRLAENDQTINPLYFGLPYSDPIAPTIAGVKLYPGSPHSTIAGRRNELKVYPTSQTGKSKKTKMRSSVDDTISVAGRFYTGIYTYDRMEQGSNSKNGVERIELFVDDTLFSTFNIATFLFEESRAVNAQIDYREYERSREYYILSRRLRGDPTNFNNVSRDGGYLHFDDGRVHSIRYRVSDYKGNSTSRTVYVRGERTQKRDGLQDDVDNIEVQGEPIAYYKPFFLVGKGFVLNVEANNIYENDHVVYRTAADAGGITQQHNVSLRRNPLPPHDHIDVALAIPDGVSEVLRPKLVVVCVNGKKVTACPSKNEEGRVVARSRSWGAFALRADTIAPVVQPLDFVDGKALRGTTMSVRVSDNLSGIEQYSCTANGEWQVVEHDGKTSSLTLDCRLLRGGKNTVVFTVTDAVGNVTTKEFTVYK